MAALKPGMGQLCSNILGSLVQKGFFLTLRVSVHEMFNRRLDGARLIAEFQRTDNSAEGHVPADGHIEADFIASNPVAVRAAADFGQFHRQFDDHVSRAHSVDAGARPSGRDTGARQSANISIAQNSGAQPRDTGRRAIDEDHQQQHERHAITGAAGQYRAFVPFGVDRIGHTFGIPYVDGKRISMLCCCCRCF